MNDQPYILWDFQGIDKKDRAILWYEGVKDDLAAQGAVLAKGMKVLLWADDEDLSGNPALMIVDGVVAEFDSIKNWWVADVHWSTLRYEAIRHPPWRT